MSNFYEPCFNTSRLDLQTCVVQYQQSKNETLLQVILYKLRGTIDYYLYRKTNYPDKTELVALYEDKLLDCLSSYDAERNASFITYYCYCLNNALYNFIKDHKTVEMSLDYEYSTSYHVGESESDGNTLLDRLDSKSTELEDVESEVLLSQLAPHLDSNEYAVCRVILNEPHKLKYKEIADELNLTTAAIPAIIKRLQKKFKSELLLGKVIKSV